MQRTDIFSDNRLPCHHQPIIAHYHARLPPNTLMSNFGAWIRLHRDTIQSYLELYLNCTIIRQTLKFNEVFKSFLLGDYQRRVLCRSCECIVLHRYGPVNGGLLLGPHSAALADDIWKRFVPTVQVLNRGFLENVPKVQLLAKN
jgi:hypothetical protein